MSADDALSGVCRLTFAVELQERAHENRVSSGRAIIPLEGLGGLARHIRPARRQIGARRVAEVLHAPPTVGEVRTLAQIPAAAVARGDRAKRTFGFSCTGRSTSPKPWESAGSRAAIAMTSAVAWGEGFTSSATKEVNPFGRVGRIEELQNLAAFLLSDGCEWLTGERIAMDGAQALATGGNFYELRQWGDADWKAARAAIEAQNARDRAQRG